MIDPPIPAYVLGTDRLGRPLTRDEALAFEKELLARGFHAARNAGVLFGHRLSRNAATAEDLVQRAFERMVRLGWDPAEIGLKERLLRLVWSEWTNWLSERDRDRKATAIFVHDLAMKVGTTAPTPVDLALRLEEENAEEAKAQAKIDSLRAHLTRAKDTVNLAWLDLSLQGKTDLAEMALLTGRKVEEFYAAAKRRKRLVLRIAAEGGMGVGVRYDEDETKEPES